MTYLSEMTFSMLKFSEIIACFNVRSRDCGVCSPPCLNTLRRHLNIKLFTAHVNQGTADITFSKSIEC